MSNNRTILIIMLLRYLFKNMFTGISKCFYSYKFLYIIKFTDYDIETTLSGFHNSLDIQLIIKDSTYSKKSIFMVIII